MNRRDLLWIVVIWIVALGLAATVPAFFADDDPKTNDAAGAFILAALLGAVATGLYVYARRQSWDRRDVLVVATLWVFLLGTVIPPGVMTGNTYLAGLAAGFVGALLTGAYLDRSRERRRAEQAAPPGPRRTCPRCEGHMSPESSTCPFCSLVLTPWTLRAGFWWRQAGSTGWQWLDEPAGVWRWYDVGTPSTPSGTRITHGLEPGCAPVDSRAVDPTGRVDTSTTQSSGDSA
jgi:hypothetical protein